MSTFDVVYGVDFGTSNSAIAVSSQGGVSVIGGDGVTEKTMPSFLLFTDEDEVFVGEQALRRYVESGMKGRFIQSFKTFLSDPGFTTSRIGRRSYSLEDLVAYVLKDLKRQADLQTGAECEVAILGRPARFSSDEREDRIAQERLIQAAYTSGFRKLALQIEPIAAAYDYEATLDHEELVLVVDCGGGTSDLAVIRLSPERTKKSNRDDDVLGSNGISVAGDVFDSRIMWEKITPHLGRGSQWRSFGNKMLDIPTQLLWELCQWHRVPFLNTRKNHQFLQQLLHSCTDKQAITTLKTIIEKNLGLRLFEAVNRAKYSLSSREDSTIFFREGKMEIFEPLSHSELDGILQKEIERIDLCVSQLLKDSQLSENGVDAVFLTGGTSNLRQIKQVVSQRFGAEKVRSLGPGFTSVARGLAMSVEFLEFF